MTTFSFEKLDVYQCARQFLALARKLEELPKGHSELADQLRRAAVSIPLNIAEGTGKFDRDAKRFYSIARGSARECAAIVDAIEVLDLRPASELAEGKEPLKRIVEMLTVMVRR